MNEINMAKAPYFPFFVRDWLCSRKVRRMSGDAAKAYMYLLSESWLSEPRATLPNDDRELSSLCFLGLDEFLKIKTEIMQCFKVGKCREHKGFLYNEMLLEISRKCEAKQRPNNKNAKRTQNERKRNADSEYEIENENESGSGSEEGGPGEDPKAATTGALPEPSPKKKKEHIPPRIEDVTTYCTERGNAVDPETFYDFYESKGWQIGKERMKSWKASVRTWERRPSSSQQTAGPQKKPSYREQKALQECEEPDYPIPYLKI